MTSNPIPLLNAPTIESYEKCRRRWLWEQSWEMIRATPLGLLYDAVRGALTAKDYTGPDSAKSFVMNEAGERGIWTDRHDPYDMAVHYAHLAEVLARILRQPSAEPLTLHPPVMTWTPDSYLLDGGLRLMRVVLADHWDENRQLAELHSWRTVGDVCATGLPMTIRVIVIGHSRSGRRHSFWTKGQLHPVNKALRFQRKHGKADGLALSWKPVWREDSGIDAQAWLEQMARDGVLRELAFDRKVEAPGKVQRDRVMDDVKRIAEEMRRLESPVTPGEGNKGAKNTDLGTVALPPMTRSACDDPLRGACAYQCCCFAPTEIRPADTGVFRVRLANIQKLPK